MEENAIKERKKSLGLTMRQSMYDELKAIADMLDRPVGFMLREAAAPMMAYYSKVYVEHGSLQPLTERYDEIAMDLLTNYFSRKQYTPRQITLTLDEKQYDILQFLADKTSLQLEEILQFILNEYFAVIFEQQKEKS